MFGKIVKRAGLIIALAMAILLVSALALPVSGAGSDARGDGAPVFSTRTSIDGRGPAAADFVPGEVIVKFKETAPGAGIDRLLSHLHAAVKYTSARLGFRVVSIPEGLTVPGAVAKLKADPLVEYAEPNYINRIQTTVNDPYYPYQWHLENPRSGSIHVEQAWDLSSGKSDVVVAVVDTGVAYENHGQYQQAPDLAQTLFCSPYDAVDGDGHPDDTHGHGTHVTGTIAQSTNNSIGVAGAAFGCTIMPVRALGNSGGTHAQTADAFCRAADAGADVINHSAGGSSSNTMYNACLYAYQRGVTVVCASGNDSGSIIYPAAYDGLCIAVGATAYDESLTWYSNYGPQQDFVAPGGDTRADLNGDGYADGVLQMTYRTARDPASGFNYQFWQGTSMAAPHVSALAALVISMSGVRDNPDYVYGVMRNTAKDLGSPGQDPYYGHGLVNAAAALRSLLPPPPPPAQPVKPKPRISKLKPNSGKVGACITIRGKHFGKRKAGNRKEYYVRFGRKKATKYQHWSDTTIKVKVPGGIRGSVKVTVTNPAGKSNCRTFRVTK